MKNLKNKEELKKWFFIEVNVFQLPFEYLKFIINRYRSPATKTSGRTNAWTYLLGKGTSGGST